MKLLLAVLFLLFTFVLFYVFYGRTWLRAQPWAQGFFEWAEPIEAFLWKKSESILFARFMMLIGILPLIAQQITMFNIPELIMFIPEKWRPWLMLTFTICGIIVEFNRRHTTEPLEITAMPEAEKTPEVKEAIAAAEEAKDVAVATVEVAKEEAKVEAKAEADAEAKKDGGA